MADGAELLAATRDALAGSSASFVEMLRLVPDASVPAVGEWDVGEAAAHVAASGPFFLSVAQGEQEPEDLEAVAVNNAAILAADPERDLAVLADRIEASDSQFVAFLDSVRGDPVLEVFRGVRAPLSTLVAVEAGELLVHGFDIAKASNLPWEIARDHAAPAATALLPLLPHLVATQETDGFEARFEVRIRGGGAAVVEFAAGAARIEVPSGKRVDCHISVDPAAYLLLGFNRIGQLRPLLAGKMLSWGRRPWLALKFPSLFRSV